MIVMLVQQISCSYGEQQMRVGHKAVEEFPCVESG